jgi:hypothetical protein
MIQKSRLCDFCPSHALPGSEIGCALFSTSRQKISRSQLLHSNHPGKGIGTLWRLPHPGQATTARGCGFGLDFEVVWRVIVRTLLRFRAALNREVRPAAQQAMLVQMLIGRNRHRTENRP